MSRNPSELNPGRAGHMGREACVPTQGWQVLSVRSRLERRVHKLAYSLPDKVSYVFLLDKKAV